MNVTVFAMTHHISAMTGVDLVCDVAREESSVAECAASLSSNDSVAVEAVRLDLSSRRPAARHRISTAVTGSAPPMAG